MAITVQDIETLVAQLSLNDQLVLMEHLAQNIRQNTEKKTPSDICGLWKKKLPEDFDLDATLREIRNAWKEDFPELKT